MGAAATALAHEEDWRKLADRETPVKGETWRLGDGGERSSQFDAQGITLLSQVPTNQIGTGGSGSDCWGYVSPSGREYALMTVETGLGVIEVTDPTNPVVVGFIGSANSIWHDVKVLGEYAYKVNESGNGIQVIDLRDVDNGNVSLIANVRQGGHTTTHNIIANPDTGYLYLAGANVANGGLIAVSTANPQSPSFAGSWNNRYVHDAQVVTMQVGAYAGREIAFCFNGGAGVEIIDVTDKSNMVKIGGSSYPQIQYCHQGWLSEDQQYLYVNDELDEGVTVSQTTTRVFRIHDPNWTGAPGSAPSPANPVFVGTFTSGRAAIDHNLYTRDGVIFQANYRSGLRVFDATADGANPTQIAFFDTYPGSDSANFNGAWNVYPYLPSRTVLVSDIERGLFVLRLDVGPTAQAVGFDFEQAPGGQVGPNEAVTVRVRVDENNVTPDAAGYRLRTVVNGDALGETAMTQVAGQSDLYEATVGGFACFDRVELTVAVDTQEGLAFESAAVAFDVIQSVEQIADAEQETTEWTTGGSATAGGWQFGTPVAAGRGDPPSDADGTGGAWLTQNDLGPSGDGNSDIDNGEVSLVTKTYDLAGGGWVTYRWWLNDVSGGTLSPEDYLSVEVRVDGGIWRTAREYTTAGATWRDDQISFGAGEEFEAGQVQLRFAAADFGSQGVVEAGLDAFFVQRGVCDAPACPADLTGDSLVNADDLLVVLGSFGVDGGGDATGDGFTDADDLLVVLGGFGQSCP